MRHNDSLSYFGGMTRILLTRSFLKRKSLVSGYARYCVSMQGKASALGVIVIAVGKIGKQIARHIELE